MKAKFKSTTAVALSMLIAAGAAMAPTSAGARIVFDPTNFVGANLANFYQLVKSLAEAKQHTEQFKDMLKNEFPMADANVLYNATELVEAVRQMQATVDSLQKNFAASPYTDWNGYITDVTKRAEDGNDSAKALIETAYEADARVRSADSAYRSVMGNLPKVKGVTEAAQATANAVGVVIQQNQAALGIMSAQARDTAMTRAEATAERKHEDMAIKKFRDTSDQALEAMKQMRVQ
jgi:hypothetical protein